VHAVSVQITGFVDNHFPGFVSCALRDAEERTWQFVDKVPVFSVVSLTNCSVYPQPGVIRCQVVSRFVDPSGRAVVRVNTGTPDGVESTDGNTIFDVFAEQVVEIACDA
jgi:hypothetical protein